MAKMPFSFKRSDKRSDETQQIPAVNQAENANVTLPAESDGKTTHNGANRRWVKWVVGILAFFIGVGIGVAGSGDPTQTTQYKELQSQLLAEQEKYSETQDRLDALEKESDDLKELKSQLDAQKQDLDEREKKVEDLEKKSGEVDKLKKEVEEQQKKLDEKEKEQEERQSQLDEREKNIANREAEKQQRELQVEQVEQQKQVEQQQEVAQKQQTSTSQQTTTAPVTSSQGTAHGGAFCSPLGATAQSDRSTSILTCRVAADGRLRWKK